MSADSQEQSILDLLRLVATGAGSISTEDVGQRLDQLATQLGQLQEASHSQAEVVVQNTQAVLQSATAQATSGGSSTAEIIQNAVTSVLGSGLSLVPIIGGLLSLFGGGDSSQTATKPEKYSAPASLAFSLGFSEAAGGEIQTVDYEQEGMPRLVEALARSSGQGTETQSPSVLDYLQQSALPGAPSGGDWVDHSGAVQAYQPGTGTGAGNQTYSPQITIQVQAMDSRSFLDHSDEIASAVREALLSSHALNDAIAEL